jgi:hypothetical protein
MSRGAGLHRLTGGIAKREREQWERLAAGWPCQLERCSELGVALIFDWAGNGRPVCAEHAEQGRQQHGYRPQYPPGDITPVPPPTDKAS